MSLTKRSEAYERWAEEQRHGDPDRNSYEEYQDDCYHQQKAAQQRFPVDDEQPEHPSQKSPIGPQQQGK